MISSILFVDKIVHCFCDRLRIVLRRTAAYGESVPHIRPGSAQGNADAVRAVVSVPAYILNETAAGDSYGQIQYMLDGVVLETVPLVADRTMTPAGAAGRFWGELAARRIR